MKVFVGFPFRATRLVLIGILVFSFFVWAFHPSPVQSQTAPKQTARPQILIGDNVNVGKLAGNQHENAIAINPIDPNQIVVIANTEISPAGVARSYSTNGGVTWTTDVIGNGDSLGYALGDPALAWDRFGNLFFVYLHCLDPLSGCLNVVAQIALSVDGGKTFSQLSQLSRPTLRAPSRVTPNSRRAPLIGVNADQPKVAVGTNSVWVMFNSSGDNLIHARGASVSGLGVIDSFNDETAPGSLNGNFGDVAVGPAGQVLVTYQDNSHIFVNLDADGLGVSSFGGAVIASTTNVGYSRVIPAQFNGGTANSNDYGIDAEAKLGWDRSSGAHNGRVYLIYTDAANTTTDDTDIYQRYSDNNGATWSARLKVNDDGGTKSQFLPRVAVDQTTGNIAMSWYDARNDFLNSSAQLWATYSTDGGASIALNFQVSAGTSNAAASEPAASEYRALGYGDYVGLAFQSGSMYPSWADNSNSTGDNPDGSLSKMDVYTARISIGAAWKLYLPFILK